MKLFDRVRVISDDYKEYGIKKGDEKCLSVKIEDLELVEDSGTSDETILECLPLRNPEWGCKVIDGYIYNLKGERMNESAYDYYHRRKNDKNIPPA